MAKSKRDIMMEHTPGPWEIKEHTSGMMSVIGLRGDANRADGVKQSVAAIGYLCEPEVQANAQLIAAAPELLRVAKAALFFYNNPNEFPTASTIQFWKETIAKAEGKAPDNG